MILSLIHWLFERTLLGLQNFVNSPGCYWFLTLSHHGQRRYFVWYLLETTDTYFVAQYMVYPGKYPISSWEECVCCCCCWLGEGGVLHMSLRSSRFIVLLKASISSLIFCLVVLSIILSEVLESTTITVEPSIFSFSSLRFCFLYFDGLTLHKCL